MADGQYWNLTAIKLIPGVLGWLETVALPGIMSESVDYRHLPRARNFGTDHRRSIAVNALVRIK